MAQPTSNAADANGFDVPDAPGSSAAPITPEPAPQKAASPKPDAPPKAAPKPKLKPKPDEPKELPVLHFTANDLVDFSRSSAKHVKQARLEQLAREHPEVRELLDELEKLRGGAVGSATPS